MSNTIPHTSSNEFAEILPTDLDPVSPGSINESGNESANLNDSITSKTIDDADNVSRDVNKESNLDVNEASNESKVSGMSDLSSHGSTTKLDISESAHLPGDKSEIIADSVSSRNQIIVGDGEKSKGDNVMGGPYDFDNFSNLKEKLMKTDPLNKNLDKDKIDSASSNLSCIASDVANLGKEKTLDNVVGDLKDSVSFSSNNEENQIEKRLLKSPIGFVYSEDSLGSNCSQRSKIKLEKNNLLNESTRNSLVMDCDDSSASFMEKKLIDAKEPESVSYSEVFKEESQLSLASNDSRKFSSFSNVKLTNENSRNRSEASSPDISKTMSEEKKKDDRYTKRSHSALKGSGDKPGSQYDSKHRSQDSSRERKSKSSGTLNDRGKKHNSDSKRDSYSQRDRYSSRSREDRHKSDSKSSRYGDSKTSYDESKRDRDYKRSSNYDDRKRSNGDSKRKIRGKESHYSSDDDKRQKFDDTKGSDNKCKVSKTVVDKNTSTKESRTTSDYKNNRKEDSKRNSEDQKNLRRKDKDPKYGSDYKVSSDKNTKSSEEDKYLRKDKDPKKSTEDSKNSRRKDKDDSKNAFSYESKSSKSSASRLKEEEKYSKKDKECKVSDDKPPKKNDCIAEGEKPTKPKIDSSNDKNKINSKLSTDKKCDGSDKDKRKGSSSSGSNPKSEEKDSKKRKRENCSEDAERRDNRRSRDRDDGGNKNSGASTAKDQKDLEDKKKKTGSSKQERTNSNGSKRTKETSDTSSGSPHDVSDQGNDDTNCNPLNDSTVDLVVGANSPNCFKRPSDDNLNTFKKHKSSNNSSSSENVLDTLLISQDEENPCTVPSYYNNIDGSAHLGNTSEAMNITSDVAIESADAESNVNQHKLPCIYRNSNDENDINLDSSVEDFERDEIFYGFDNPMMDISYKMAVNFENFMKNFYRTESNPHMRPSDKCFSLTDNNLNNIDLKNVYNLERDILKSSGSSHCSSNALDEYDVAENLNSYLFHSKPVVISQNVRNKTLNESNDQDFDHTSKKILVYPELKEVNTVKLVIFLTLL